MLSQLLALLLLASSTITVVPIIPTNATPPDDSAPLESDGNQISSNWAGYVAQGGTFSAVGASWVVPTTTNSIDASLSTDATWVGIGGVMGRDLIQTGTQTIFQNGSVKYEAWYETLPNDQTIIPLTIHEGDSVTASLQETSTNLWHLSFKNNSTGGTYDTNIAYASSKTSAEWIEERPVVIAGRMMAYSPLDNFGSVTFTDAFTIKNDVRTGIAGSGAEPLTMASGGGAQTLATTSALAANDSFTVTRVTNNDTVAQQVGMSEQRLVPVRDELHGRFSSGRGRWRIVVVSSSGDSSN